MKCPEHERNDQCKTGNTGSCQVLITTPYLTCLTEQKMVNLLFHWLLVILTAFDFFKKLSLNEDHALHQPPCFVLQILFKDSLNFLNKSTYYY